ncbi:MAG TPA: KH domain-containing protein [Verrucomicrobiales bacterium]|nr:KH domain-containing protein [Verrucomicrobiales bacterium]
MDTATAFREFIEYVVGQLIQHPDRASIAHQLGDSETSHIFNVVVEPDDLGVVLGKNGQTVAAIRSILNAAADRDGVSVAVNFVSRAELP